MKDSRSCESDFDSVMVIHRVFFCGGQNKCTLFSCEILELKSVQLSNWKRYHVQVLELR